ncbi:PPOX class F420-dependent oxidoreductase [Gordonia shandongensis]|uniref:PPOX class F420-dependent oxidoreductase n=1 Tax=Gordonia shandongensis TaxID=376351 RepID=UPI00041CEB3B|nr:PPOX class F420-dependent oxidoreductase [Gordonia shandongensis]
MAFTADEIEYIRTQPLARVATVSADGQPDAVPVGFQFDGRDFYIGGYDPTNTRRARNIRSGNHKVALVIDDLASTRPWVPRYLRVYGTAELVSHRGQDIMKVTPVTSWSVNIDGGIPAGGPSYTPKKTVHARA